METKEALRRALRYLYREINKRDCKKVLEKKGMAMKRVCEEMKTKDKESYLFLKEMYANEIRKTKLGPRIKG